MANQTTGVRQPTHDEWIATEQSLRANGYSSATTRHIEYTDRKYATRHISVDVVDWTPVGFDVVDSLTREELLVALTECQLSTTQFVVINNKLRGCTLREIANANSFTISKTKRYLDSAVTSLRGQLPVSKWYGLLDILRALDTRRSNWPARGRVE